jgi:monoamine oxidase
MTSKLHPSFGITMIYDTSDEEIENTGTTSPSRSNSSKFYALTVFSCGRQAANLRTLNTGDARKSWVVQAMQSLFGDGAKDVLAHSEVDWSSHGYIGGAYAAIPAVGALSANRQDSGQTLYDLMASSVGHIHFAGNNNNL